MDGERAAKEADRRHAKSELANAANCCFFDARVRGEAEIIVRREHDQISSGDTHNCALLRFDERLRLERLGSFETFQFCSDCVVQESFFSRTMTPYMTKSRGTLVVPSSARM